MSDDNFFGPEWDLANIAANTVWGDAFLADLIEDAEDGFGSAIGVLANGMVAVGTVASARLIAQELDFQREVTGGSAERPDEVSPEDWEERLKLWASHHQRTYELAVQERKEVEEKVDASDDPPWDYSTPPKGLAREALEASLRTMLTLSDVQIVAPGQSGVLQAPVMRFALRQISGWWPIRVNEEGRASFRLFTTENH